VEINVCLDIYLNHSQTAMMGKHLDLTEWVWYITKSKQYIVANIYTNP